MREITVALADDHPVVLAGIKALLQGADEIRLVGEATSASAALELICQAQPDVAVIDISLPDQSGLDLAGQLRERCPGVRILAMTVHEDRAYVQPMLQAGVRGYLLKRSAAEDLTRAIRAIAEGGVYLDPAIAEKALGQDSPPSGHAAGVDLSARETDVLTWTARGLSNKEIAARMEISIKTVETYKARATEKLGLRSRADIVRHGVRMGWLDAGSN